MFGRFVYCFILISGICCLNAVNASAQQAEAIQIIVIRHAEKNAGNTPDPELSPLGRKRAERIRTLLKEMKVDRLYATPYKRTQQTLEPLASERKLQTKIYYPDLLAELADTLQQAQGQTIVVAGHANTAPALVNMLLKNNRFEELREEDFSKMWIITILPGRQASCLLLNTN